MNKLKIEFLSVSGVSQQCVCVWTVCLFVRMCTCFIKNNPYPQFYPSLAYTHTHTYTSVLSTTLDEKKYKKWLPHKKKFLPHIDSPSCLEEPPIPQSRGISIFTKLFWRGRFAARGFWSCKEGEFHTRVQTPKRLERKSATLW